MKNKFGIYMNLDENTEYFHKVYDHIFYFSSLYYKDKFEKYVENYVKIETIKFYNKYKIEANLNITFAFAFYKSIEKRGFRIETKNKNLITR